MRIARRRVLFLVLAVLLAGVLVASLPVVLPRQDTAPPPVTPEALTAKVTGPAVTAHLEAFQRIADAHGGNRAAGTPGYDASLTYVADKLRSAGYDVSTPEFSYGSFSVQAARLTVAGAEVPVDALTYSPSTPPEGLSATLAVIPQDPTSGCEPTDFAGMAPGAVALIRRGTCPFAAKAQNAQGAGAGAVLIAANTDEPLQATLGDPNIVRIPVGGVTRQDGDRLAGMPGAAAALVLQTKTEVQTTRNLIAQTRTGNPDSVVMAGAHLDSVPAGPGINDNGSGSAALLEVALALGGSPGTPNAVRFAWWGAEELGLVGSTSYVQTLTEEDRARIRVYLNFDMVASPNVGYFVYDGDDSAKQGAGPGPPGSAEVEQTLAGYLSSVGVTAEDTDYDGRSDYGPFIQFGIPAGGIFTGAENIKTPAQATSWGGRADTAFDPCYHQACDNMANVDRVALERNADAIAAAVGKYATAADAPRR